MFRRQSSTSPANPGAADLDPAGRGLVTLEPRGTSRREPAPGTGAETPGRQPRHTRHTRRAQAREAADAAARQAREAADAAAAQARLQRVQQRLADVGSAPMSRKPAVIDDDAARRDPMTRPFPMVFGTPRAPRDEHGRRVRSLGTERRPGLPGVVR